MNYYRCRNITEEGHCKSDEEINQFIRKHRLVVVYNQQQYKSEEYSFEKIISKNSQVFWLDLEESNPKQNIYEIQKHSIESDDLFFNLGYVESTKADFFSLQESPLRKMTQVDGNVEEEGIFVGGTLITINMDQFIHKRSIYNFLDFLGDVGGL